MIRRVFASKTLEKRPELVESVRKVMQSTSAQTIAASMRGMATRPDRMDDLARITIPALVLVGSDDVITPISDARAMAEKLPHATLVVVPEAGHLAPLENHSVCNAEILSFLNRFV